MRVYPAWAIEEYARRRFRFVCESAARFPSVMVTMHRTSSKCGHSTPVIDCQTPSSPALEIVG